MSVIALQNMGGVLKWMIIIIIHPFVISRASDNITYPF